MLLTATNASSRAGLPPRQFGLLALGGVVHYLKFQLQAKPSLTRTTVMNLRAAQNGNLFIVSAPSGCGKSTLVRLLCERDTELTLSVSTTTRPRRPHEQEGRDYYFVTESEFSQMAEQGKFLESATVFGHQYGTNREFVDTVVSQGNDVLFDIDWQGARQIKKKYKTAYTFFLIPPSMEELRMRLVKRQQDDIDTIDYRMAKAQAEIAHHEEFDFVVINDSITKIRDLVLANIQAIRSQNLVQLPASLSVISALLSEAI